MTTRRRYWWIEGRCLDDGKAILLFGSDRSEAEAREHALELLSGQNIDWTIKMYPTRHLASASQMSKGYKLDETHNVKSSLRRVGHSKTLKRMKTRRAKQLGWGS